MDRPHRRSPTGDKCGTPTDHGPCKLSAGHGTNHLGFGTCKFHFGNAPNHVRHAELIMAEQAFQAAREKFGLSVEVTAEQALLDELWATKAEVLFYEARVAELPRDAMVYGTESVTRTRDPDGAGNMVVHEELTAKPKPHVWIVQLEKARKHHFAVAAEIARLGIEERLVQVAESHAGLVHKIIMKTAERLGWDLDDPAIAEVIPVVIRELTT